MASNVTNILWFLIGDGTVTDTSFQRLNTVILRTLHNIWKPDLKCFQKFLFTFFLNNIWKYNPQKA